MPFPAAWALPPPMIRICASATSILAFGGGNGELDVFKEGLLKAGVTNQEFLNNYLNNTALGEKLKAHAPITERIVGTARLGVSFPEDETDVGLTLGVGYRFSIFDLF